MHNKSMFVKKKEINELDIPNNKIKIDKTIKTQNSNQFRSENDEI